jgi:hypothetical protein
MRGLEQMQLTSIRPSSGSGHLGAGAGLGTEGCRPPIHIMDKLAAAINCRYLDKCVGIPMGAYVILQAMWSTNTEFRWSGQTT